MREHPIAAPEFAYEGVCVLQNHTPLRRLAHVRDDVFAFDRVVANQLRDGGVCGALMVDEVP